VKGQAAGLLAALWVVACAPAPDVAGTWQGRWESDDGAARGTFRVHVTQRGNRISGRIELDGTWPSDARVDGVVEGSRVRWGVLRGGVAVLNFEGTVAGGHSSGTYRGPGGSSGRWEARRVRPP
jgi:hypothetical protein